MNFHISSLGGIIGFNSRDPYKTYSFYITWQNQLQGFEETLPGFFCIGTHRFALECGDIDQGRPGIYWTVYDEQGDAPRSRALLQF